MWFEDIGIFLTKIPQCLKSDRRGEAGATQAKPICAMSMLNAMWCLGTGTDFFFVSCPHRQSVLQWGQ